MPIGDGAFRLYLNGQVRAATETKVGDVVEVWAEFDATYREGPAHPVPPALERGLLRRPTARRNWERLTRSRRKELLRYLAALKSDAARARNIGRALRVLGGESARFLGREWRDGG